MFHRVAIVNRGEPAMRMIHAIRELNAEGENISSIALCTDEERGAAFAREADSAHCIGPAAARPYLDLDRLAHALVATGADAAWPGWGFVAEDPAFAELCDRLGVTFVGPSAEVMRKLGDKIEAKLLAEIAGVPVAPWSRGAVADLDAARCAAGEIGYPLMLKAAAGGGGRGIRVITGAAELVDAYDRARREAGQAFGSDAVFLERLLPATRHVEVQVIGDGQGEAWALGVRDCSVQRRNQKIIEESTSPLLSAEQVDELKAVARRLALAVDYRGAATVEFLYDPREKRFSFLEVNTRLQVEHPVTEATTGMDLVKAQLRVAAGGRLTGPVPAEVGHAIEVRLNAEDPDRDFAPAPGRIKRFDPATGPGVRVDAGFAVGDVIPPDYDSMVAKLVAFGRTRDEALGRARRAVAETTVLIEGGTTNKAFLLELLGTPEIVDATADIGWIDRRDPRPSPDHRGVALVAAAVDTYLAAERERRRQLFASARRGQPQLPPDDDLTIPLKLHRAMHQVRVARIGPSRFRVAVDADERAADVHFVRVDSVKGRITLNGRGFDVLTDRHGSQHLVEVEGTTHRISHDDRGVLRAPAPALVVAAVAAEGDEVDEGEPVLVLESMKMETVLRAPFAARLTECLVPVGGQVEADAPLLRLEPLADGVEQSGGPADDLGLSEVDAPCGADRVSRGVEDLRNTLLGFDADPLDEQRVRTDYFAARREAEHRPLPAEIELLRMFAVLSDLARRKPATSGVANPHEQFHAYLRCLDVEAAGLAPDFQHQLSTILGYYGISGFAHSEELEAAIFRSYLAQQRSASGVAVVTAVLRQWLADPPPSDDLRDAVREVLEELVTVAGHAVADLARRVLFWRLQQPALRRTRARTYAQVRAHLRYLDEHPEAPDRDDRIRAVMSAPEPLEHLLGHRVNRKGIDLGPILEVLLRRRRPVLAPADMRCFEVDGCTFVTVDRSLVTAADFDRFEAAAEAIAKVARDEVDTVVDVYLSWPEPPADTDAMAAELHRVLTRAAQPEMRRLTVSVLDRAGCATQHFTFRPQRGGIAEVRADRGVHPDLREQLGLWRLRNFELTRLPAVDSDVHLFNCAADSVVAISLVRDLAPLRDEAGHIVALPGAEDALAAATESIAAAANPEIQVRRVFLEALQPIALTTEELARVAARFAPALHAGVVEIRFRAAHGEFRIRHPLTSAEVQVEAAPAEPIEPLSDLHRRVLRARRRGTVHPVDLIALLTRDSTFTEHELDSSGELVPVNRPAGRNTAAVVVGVTSTPTPQHPAGVTRVVLLGDPTKALGALAEPECAQVCAALRLAERMRVPVEWFALSAGAKISMDSGTENMDWVARALKAIVDFTQQGGEINVVVAGVNVGAQPYWNAEATMLMHTKGILVMTPDSAMLLTGKKALDFSGSVSAEDNFGIGGHDRVMGPNGQAQYWAPDLAGALDVLMSHYDHSYIAPGEPGPRRAITADAVDRDVRRYPHAMADSDFETVGDIFSAAKNPDRKKAFDIRTVLRAVTDQDLPMLERWADMADAQTAVVTDAHIGGFPVCLIGIESHSVPRLGFPPSDGPSAYTAGTLFPRSAKKVARAINAASGNRPLVVLANLSGFDGSPESMRTLQLEYGAEIARAVVNFRGPIVFCVISRYHGGAFVVFSKALNPRMTVLAVSGSYASVLGGAPAAAVVFAGEVDARTNRDARVQSDPTAQRTRAAVRAEKLAEVAGEFDAVHNIRRTVEVGSVDAIIEPAELRPRIIATLERELGAQDAG
ncbi:ATP-grasp domain-containing protein [Saccharopolyspora sp. K220]|uniref:ATP-binding protein n=1 Tax=Saccharopolyspora soli TaxID=2926618 RepID=UPI001F5A8327|nr:carboxyl transferase domain-containing protein [Saccharopolyspora soli]MCI2416135.1 ATP-grasp domain-containing protein [Saccharopolyspora soli]